MAECLYTDTECIKFPVDDVCANCRIRLTLADTQFASIEWQQNNGFIMIEKSCHSCKHGIYENEEEFNQAASLICEKMIKAKHNGEIVDPKQYICNLWEQGNKEGDIL
jgi:hypothetical protein